MELLGWVSAAFLTLCGAPAAWYAWKDKGCSLPWSLLSMWWLGEATGLVYVCWLGNLPLIANYLFNLICVSILCFYNRR